MFLQIVQIGIIMSILVGQILFGAYNFEVALKKQKLPVFVHYLVVLLVYGAHEFFLLDYSYYVCQFLVFPYAIAIIAFFFYQTYESDQYYGWLVLFATPLIVVSFWAYRGTLGGFNGLELSVVTGIYLATCIVLNHFDQWPIYRRMAITLIVDNLFLEPYADPYLFMTTSAKVIVILALIIGTVIQLLLTRFYFVSLRRQITSTKQMKFNLFHDELTGLMNYRAFSQYVVKEEKGKKDLIICMLDIDHFKSVNDSYGHLAGNDTLVNFARYFQKFLLSYYPDAKIYRFGGDEFCCMVLEPDFLRFVKLMKNLEANIYQQKFNTKDSVIFGLTFSAGIAQSLPDSNIIDTFQLADVRAYTAKRNGRAQIYYGDFDEYKTSK